MCCWRRLAAHTASAVACARLRHAPAAVPARARACCLRATCAVRITVGLFPLDNIREPYTAD
eukprot:scaffold78812_cov55-Phaeocystis_antarctica.AAC.1